MARKAGFALMLVLGFAIASVADPGDAHRVLDRVTSLPEASTLGLLGSGLIGFAILIRRKLRLELKPV